MYLAELKIKNFRGIKNARLVLKRRTLLIGPNNVGKTSILEAAALLLGRDKMVVDPCEWDFFNGWMFEQDATRRVAAPDGRAEKEGDEDQQAEHAEGQVDPAAHEAPANETPADVDSIDAATPTRIRVEGVLADLTKEERRLLCQPCRSGAIGAWDPKECVFAARQAKADEESAVRVAFEARFDPEEGEVVSKRFFPVDGEDPLAGDPTDPLQKKHIQAAGYFLLSSTRLWKDAVRFTSSIFAGLLRQRQVRTGDQVRRIARALEELKPKAHDAAELKELLKTLRETVGRFVALSPNAPLGFEVTELSSPDVERTLTLFLQGARDERRFPMSRHGSAAVSVQILAMLVMLGRHRRTQDQSFLLGLEEPELHLHPHAQRNLIAAVRDDATQLLVTTHSPAITECFKPDEVCVLSTHAGQLTGRYLLSHDLSEDTKNLVKRWVFTRRRIFAEALMSPAVMLVEGETEADLLPELSAIVAGTASLDELGCAVIQCDGSDLPKPLPMLERFPGLRVVLVDGDSDGDSYVEKIRAIKSEQQPHLLLRLPAGKAIERGLAHGLDNSQSEKILGLLKGSCAEICVDPPVGSTPGDLATFLVEKKLKKNPLLRDCVAEAFRTAGVVPPVVAEIRKEVAAGLIAPPREMVEKRLGNSDASGAP